MRYGSKCAAVNPFAGRGRDGGERLSAHHNGRACGLSLVRQQFGSSELLGKIAERFACPVPESTPGSTHRLCNVRRKVVVLKMGQLFGIHCHVHIYR